MHKKTMELLESLCLHELSKPLLSCKPRPLKARDAMAFLWALNERYRPRVHQIKTVRYRKQFEREADNALRTLVLAGDDWSTLPLVVWRVMLERHQQALIVCVANDLHAPDAEMLHVPEGFSDRATAHFVAVWLCHSMKLPYPVTDESKLDIDSLSGNLPSGLH